MNNILKYKGFTAKIEYSPDDEVFFGRVLNTREVITFEAGNAKDLKKEMSGTIDFYLESSAENKKEVKKNYNGKLLFRLPDDLHESIETAAASAGKSINEWGREVFENAVK